MLSLSCESVIEHEFYGVHTPEVWERARALDVPLREFNDSLEAFQGEGYLRTDRFCTEIRFDP